MNLPLFVFGTLSVLLDGYVEKFREDDKALTLAELQGDLNFPRIQTYDFIIVGGGTAGCLLAGRLSNTYSVLLLEKGGYPIPAAETLFIGEYALLNNHEINDIYTSIPQTEFAQENGGVVYNVVGKMLGGSGSHNGMAYHRGFPRDYDEYANITNDPSWNYANVSEHFKNIENFVGTLKNEGLRTKYGSGGPMTVDTQSSALLPAWGKIATAVGHSLIDPLDDQAEGFLSTLKVSQNGERVSTFTAYVQRHEGSDRRLTVLKYSEVDQILIRNDSNNQPEAYGVAYTRHGIPQIAHASKEVIVTAGALASPVLLMKSGIGPADQLEAADITLVKDLPVGQNLREHTAVVLTFTAENVNRDLMPRVEEDKFEEELTNYQAKPFRSGFFATMGGGPHAFIVSDVAKDRQEGGWPDLQITFEMMPYGLVVHDKEDCDTCQKFNLYVALNRLESFGTLKLDAEKYMNGIRSTPELAITDYNLFTEENDFKALIQGIQIAYRIATDTEPFRLMNVSYTDTVPAACVDEDPETEDYWRCLIIQRAMIWNHITGTCTMGDGQNNGVVDSQLKVRGVGKLRVADASVLPTPTGVNINAAVMVVAEKTADQIFKDYGKRETVGERNSSAAMGPMVIVSVVMVVVAYFVR